MKPNVTDDDNSDNGHIQSKDSSIPSQSQHWSGCILQTQHSGGELVTLWRVMVDGSLFHGSLLVVRRREQDLFRNYALPLIPTPTPWASGVRWQDLNLRHWCCSQAQQVLSKGCWPSRAWRCCDVICQHCSTLSVYIYLNRPIGLSGKLYWQKAHRMFDRLRVF